MFAPESSKNTTYDFWIRLHGLYFLFVFWESRLSSPTFFAIYKKAISIEGIETFITRWPLLTSIPSYQIVLGLGALGALGLITQKLTRLSSTLVFVIYCIEKGVAYRRMTPEYSLVLFCLLLIIMMPSSRKLYKQGQQTAWTVIAFTYFSYFYAKMHNPIWVMGEGFHYSRVVEPLLRDYLKVDREEEASLLSLCLNYAALASQVIFPLTAWHKKWRWWGWAGIFSFVLFVPFFYSLNHTSLGSMSVLLCLPAMHLAQRSSP